MRCKSIKILASGANVKGQLGGIAESLVKVPTHLADLSTSVAHISAAGSHSTFVGYECNNTSPPCHGAAECRLKHADLHLILVNLYV